MSNRIVLLISFFLVLALTTVSSAGLDDDPNLAGWWKFDGDAVDSSVNGRDGTLVGDAQLVGNGILGGALSLDGDGDYVTIAGYKGINADRTDPANPFQKPFTVACWINTTAVDGSLVNWGSSDGTGVGGQYQNFRVNGGRLRAEHGNGRYRGATVFNDGEWHHVAMAVAEGADLNPPGTQLYVDGRKDTLGDDTVNSQNIWNLTEDADVGIGVRASHTDRFFSGMFDDVRIYDRTLAHVEIRGLMGLFTAFDPSPVDGAVIEDILVNLSWSAGPVAVSHDVYFGTTADLATDQLVSQQVETEYVAYGLAAGTTYYWRIDDVAADGSVVTGPVWSFSTPPAGAYNPNPADGMLNAATDVTLNWTASWNPAMYSVNFGTDRDAVANAAPASAQPGASFDPGPLAASTTYYWRVDVLYTSGWYVGPVWSFTTMPEIPMTDDPNLVAHWTMDEAAGTVALDWSGNGNHVDLVGADWTNSAIVGSAALEFTGSGQYAAIRDLNYASTDITQITVSTWVRTSEPGDQYIISFDRNEYYRLEINGNGAGDGQVGWDLFTTDGQLDYGSVRRVDDGIWHHITGVFDNGLATIYIDGVAEPSITMGTAFGTGNVRYGLLGANSEATEFNGARGAGDPIMGNLDDLRIYDRALTADEIKALGRVNLAQAWDPTPASAAIGDIWTMSMLSWLPGDGATEHDVYFGTDAAAVEAADVTDATSIYRGRQADAAYLVSEGLAFEAAYFWRVDEVAADGTVTMGRIWSLTTLDEIVIYGEETPFPYDNTAEPYLSEISLDMDPALDLNKPIGRFAISYTGAAAGGSVSVDDAAGTVTVVGRGADIWGTADQFQYAYTMLTGDGSMTVKVDSLAHTDNWSKAGIMIRQTLDAGSPFAAVYATGTNGVRFQARTMADQDATSDTSVATDEQKALNAPVWLKIERAFPMMNAYYSTDGTTWTPMSWNPQVIPLTPAPVYIGLAVTSHSGDTTFAEAVFSNLSSEGGVAAGPLTSTEVGLVSNSAEPMYLVLEDASGASAAVMNPDPAATQQTSATDWIVDLGQYAIDLSAVTKATLVVGNLDAPAPGGKGELTIHNVRLLPWQPLVMWVSFHEADDMPSSGAAGAGLTEAADKPYTDLLKADGYNVVRYVTTNTPDPAVLNAADLVIISRSVASGGYQNDGATAWNNISAPMIIVNGYVLRSSRMGYTTGGTMVDTTGDIKLTVSDSAHPIFAGISLVDGTMVNPYAGVVTYSDGTLARGISINNNPIDDEGTLLATISEASAAEGPVGGMVIAEWPAGATLEHSGGAGTDVLAGHRLVILTGSREASGISSETAGMYDLYQDGAQMLLNAVDYMIE